MPHPVAPRHRVPITLALALAAIARAAGAQSISPPIAEYREKPSGSFTVRNESVFPLTVTLQPRGFRVTEDGEVIVEPLDTTRIRLSLSTLSFRLQPRQGYTVFYDARVDSMPAWFTIWSAITGAKTAGGVNIRIELPHVVYVYQKQRLTAPDVHITSVRWLRQQRQVVVEVENTSPRLGRAQELLVTAAKVPPVRGSPFPSFPAGRRRSIVPWTAEVPPERVTVRFDGFRLESSEITVDDSSAPPPPAPSDSGPPVAPSDSSAD